MKRYGDRKGQITLFIIVGLLILFAFLLLFSLRKNIQSGQLEREKEETFTGIFRKEALQLYVEGCLRIELEQAIIVVGKQGRLWSDQPGGRRTFTEGETGKTVNGERVFYAITAKDYNLPGAYPCIDELEKSPFCEYSFPKTAGIDFGKLELRTSTIRGDLQRYLAEKTVTCVEQFAQSEISRGAVVEQAEADVQLRLQDDVISVSVNYPLTFTIGGETFSHPSSFNFFYRSKLKQFLDSAVAFSLEREQKYVDYSYDQDALTKTEVTFQTVDEDTGVITQISQNTPAATITALSVGLEKENADGDTLFRFTLPALTIVNTPGEYVFQFLRQNRPPALDYVSQCPGDGYDYLAVAGAEGSLGKIDLTLEAHDPDEGETITYSVSPDILVKDTDNHFSIVPTLPETYTLTAGATDEHTTLYNQDIQNINVRVDPLVQPELQFVNLIDGSSTISLEDPFCVIKTTPDIPPGAEAPGFSFTLNGQRQELQDGENSLVGIESQGSCELENYDITSIKNQILQIFPQKGNHLFRVEGQVMYGNDPLCSYNAVVEEPVTVRECTPSLPDSNFPYPYMDHPQLASLYQLDIDGERVDRNEFEVSRACCTSQGTVVPEAQGTECYSGDGCFTNTFYMDHASVKCDGRRGNICGGQAVIASPQLGKNICGRKNLPFCSDAIADRCQEREAYSVMANSWCAGNNGCENYCTSAIVERNIISERITSIGVPYPGQVNEAQFVCGCRLRQGRACDGNFDRIFDGTCGVFSCNEQ